MNSVQELSLHFMPFGYLDIKRVCQIWDELWLYEWDLFDIIKQTSDDIGIDLFEIDPVYSVLDYVLNLARTNIEDITGYDFLNDFDWKWSEIYTDWNYLDSGYDYWEEALEELKNKVKSSLEELRKDKFTKYFLNSLEIDV